MSLLADYKRQLRVRSILLASHRKPSSKAWGWWLQLEIAKGLIPTTVLAFLALTEIYRVSEPVFLGSLALGGVWMIFVVGNAWSAFRRVNKKHIQMFEDAGVQYNWQDCLLGGRGRANG